MLRAALTLAALLGSLGGACRQDRIDCPRRAARLGERLMAYVDAPAVRPPADFTPIEAPGGAPIAGRSRTLAIDRAGRLRFDDRPSVSADELGRGLAQSLELEPKVNLLYLMVDAGAPVAALRDALAAVPAGMEPRLVIFGPVPLPDPGDDALRARPSIVKLRAALDGAEPNDKASTLARAMEPAVAPCAPLVKVFGSVAAPDVDKGRYMAEHVPEALRACNCRMRDYDLVEWSLLAIFGVWDRPQRWVPVPAIPPDAAGTAGALVAR